MDQASDPVSEQTVPLGIIPVKLPADPDRLDHRFEAQLPWTARSLEA